MNRVRGLLLATVALSVVVSFGAAFPLTNTMLNDNADGWFTTNNLNEYGNDLDQRVANGEWVFTGHPAYLIDSDNARLVFDRSRVHYFAITFRGTELGDRQYERLAAALSNGSAQYAINHDMTKNMLQWDGAQPAREAFVANYCAVDEPVTQRLYAQTGGRLLRYVGNETCPPERRPVVGGNVTTG